MRKLEHQNIVKLKYALMLISVSICGLGTFSILAARRRKNYFSIWYSNMFLKPSIELAVISPSSGRIFRWFTWKHTFTRSSEPLLISTPLEFATETLNPRIFCSTLKRVLLNCKQNRRLSVVSVLVLVVTLDPRKHWLRVNPTWLTSVRGIIVLRNWFLVLRTIRAVSYLNLCPWLSGRNFRHRRLVSGNCLGRASSGAAILSGRLRCWSTGLLKWN